jgi:hypothetical protein
VDYSVLIYPEFLIFFLPPENRGDGYKTLTPAWHKRRLITAGVLFEQNCG